MGLANAQGDNFFRGGFDSYENRDGDETTGGISNYGIGETVPLGSGLLVLVAAGVGYAVVRRKRFCKDGMTILLACALLIGMTQCKKKVETVHTTDATPVFITLDVNGGEIFDAYSFVSDEVRIFETAY